MTPPSGPAPDESPPARLRATVGLVVALQVGVAALFAHLSGHAGSGAGSPRAVAGLAAAFAVAGVFTLRLEFRRHQTTFTLADAVLTAGFFVAGPVGVGLAAALGEAASLGVRRVAPLKVVFNAANRLAAATVAGAAFWAVGRTDPADATAWLSALVAALVFCVLDIVATSGVVAYAERERFDHVFVRAVTTGLLTTLAAAPLGPVALSLWDRGSLAPLLLVPVVVAVALNSRHAAAQRDEHLRYERLYQASSRTVRLAAFRDVLAALTGEARSLGTGLLALGAARDSSGRWVGVGVDDTTAKTLDDDTVDALVRLASDGSRELAVEALPVDANLVASLIPEAGSIVVALSSPGVAEPLVLAVLRQDRTDAEGREGRVQTLAAFANHAALTASNAGLFEDLEEALARQIDLNRQKGEFVAAVSHELRTPLAGMRGAIETLHRLDGRLGEEQRSELMAVSTEQGERLQRLIDELLLVAAAEHAQSLGADEDVDVAGLIATVVRDTTPLARGRVVSDVADPAPVLRSDAGKLRQVLTNLVENAAKYAPEGAIELRVAATGPTVAFTVADHGPGIPPEDRDRVFERFVQLDQSSTRRQGGTGLGLYLCRRLAGVLGGTVVLGETPGGGATFTLEVPAVVHGTVEPPAGIASDEGSSSGPAAAAAPAAATAAPFAGVRTRPGTPPPEAHPSADDPAAEHADGSPPAPKFPGVRARPGTPPPEAHPATDDPAERPDGSSALPAAPTPAPKFPGVRTRPGHHAPSDQPVPPTPHPRAPHRTDPVPAETPAVI